MAKIFNPKKRERATTKINTPVNTVTEVVNAQLVFDYSKLKSFEENDRKTLMTYEKELLLQKKRVGEIVLIVGKTLEEARKLFLKYNNGSDESYMEWHEALGYNKDQVYLLRGRYRLSLENPSYKEQIQSLSDAEIKEVINKTTPKYLVNKVLQGEVRTAKKIKEERKGKIEKIETINPIKESNVITKKTPKDRIIEIDQEIYNLEIKIKLLREERAELVKKL